MEKEKTPERNHFEKTEATGLDYSLKSLLHEPPSNMDELVTKTLAVRDAERVLWYLVYADDAQKEEFQDFMLEQPFFDQLSHYSKQDLEQMDKDVDAFVSDSGVGNGLINAIKQELYPWLAGYKGHIEDGRLFEDYVGALDNFYLAGHSIDELNRVDSFLSPRMGGLTDNLIEYESSDTRLEFAKINTTLRSPALLSMYEQDRRTLHDNPITTSMYSFGRSIKADRNPNAISELLNNGNVVSNMNAVVTLSEVSKFFDGSPHWGYENISEKIIGCIQNMSERTDINPLQKVVARSSYESLVDHYRDSFEYGHGGYDYFGATAAGSFRDWDESGVTTHKVSSDGVEVYMSPGGRALGIKQDSESLQTFEEWLQGVGELGRVKQGEEMQQFAETFFLPQVRESLGKDLTVNLNNLGFEAQMRLVEWMASQQDDRRYNELSQYLSGSEDKDKKQFLDAFLALGYGEDFSDILLDLAETTPPETLRQVLSGIENIREASGDFAEIFGDELKPQIERAVGERITEVLCVVKALNDARGHSVALPFMGETISTSGYDEVLKTLMYVGSALGDINDATASDRSKSVFDKNGVKMWQLGENGGVLLKTRRYGVKDGEFISDVEYAGEAQVNFAVNLYGFGPVPPELDNPVRREALSIRIDREGLILDEKGRKTGFDPTREHATAALDLGGMSGESDDNPNQIVGKIVSMGNLLRNLYEQTAQLHKNDRLFQQFIRTSQAEPRQNVSWRGYHTTLGGDLGEKEVFARFVEGIEARFDQSAQRDVAAFRGQSVVRAAAMPEKAAA
jgi:hypothetical protein